MLFAGPSSNERTADFVSSAAAHKGSPRTLLYTQTHACTHCPPCLHNPTKQLPPVLPPLGSMHFTAFPRSPPSSFLKVSFSVLCPIPAHHTTQARPAVVCARSLTGAAPPVPHLASRCCSLALSPHIHNCACARPHSLPRSRLILAWTLLMHNTPPSSFPPLPSVARRRLPSVSRVT